MKHFGYNFFAILGVVLVAGIILCCRTTCNNFKENEHMYKVNSPADVIALFPQSVKEIEHITDTSIQETKKTLENLIAIKPQDRTFANTFGVLDRISLSNLSIAANVIHVLEMVSPDKALRDAAKQAIVKLQDFEIDYISSNRSLYKALEAYVDGNAKKESLTDTQWFYINETMDDFKRHGLNLSDARLNGVKQLQKDLAVLALNFDTNIAQDNSTITVSKNDLQGLEEDFIAALKKNENGDYIVGVDYPTYTNVMQNCSVEQTRKRLYMAFNNRAYPINESVLKDLIAKRDQLAKKLGFNSYADLDLSDQMVKTPKNAENFIRTLAEKSAPKAKLEFKQLVSDLPQGVTLTKDGKMKPWDSSYVSNYYKKKHFNIDENLISHYFPMEKTVQGLLDIYQKFFSLTFKEETISGPWHEDVKLIAVYDAKNVLLGYLLLDLYPRDNKYSHACHSTIIPATFGPGGEIIPALSLVIANFPKSTASKPSLLKRSDVTTFFHEFGHALHALLGRTEIVSFAGTHVKRDFVEMPSQMLEEWIMQADILKQLSSHYQTGEQLPDPLIKRILELKNFDSGYYVQRQLMMSLLALQYYADGGQKDVYKIYQDLAKLMMFGVDPQPDAHYYASFGHLTGYAAKYYGYMWSKVFALDLFDEIKKHGLLNPETGKKYVHDVLGKGGSAEPMDLLKSFLGREPNQKAFLRDLGL